MKEIIPSIKSIIKVTLIQKMNRLGKEHAYQENKEKELGKLTKTKKCEKYECGTVCEDTTDSFSQELSLESVHRHLTYFSLIRMQHLIDTLVLWIKYQCENSTLIKRGGPKCTSYYFTYQFYWSTSAEAMNLQWISVRFNSVQFIKNAIHLV